MSDYRIPFIISFALILLLIVSLTTCNNESQPPPEPIPSESEVSLNRVTYYVENSGGMFGYVSGGFNNYIDTVSELAQKTEFITSEAQKEFNFINGFGPVEITNLGNSASEFTRQLNRSGFNVGNIQGNDLNTMFQMALNEAGDDTISIFISDAIYDIQQKDNPLNALVVESRETRSQFISRLNSGDNIQTLIIQLSSDFVGEYYFGSQFGHVDIDMIRPFYVFVFGNSDLMNEYLSDTYIQGLSGYQNHVRLFKTGELSTNYAVTSHNILGQFKFNRGNRSSIKDAQTDRNNVFQFSIAADLSSVPLSASELMNIDNYEVSSNFELVDIKPHKSDMLLGISEFKPSHVITMRSENPQGVLNIKLLNNRPGWINSTHTDDDTNVANQPNQTWGLQYLISGIEQAYSHMSNSNHIINMEILIE